MLRQYVYAFVLYSYLLVTAVTLVFGRPPPLGWADAHTAGNGKAFLDFCFLSFFLSS